MWALVCTMLLYIYFSHYTYKQRVIKVLVRHRHTGHRNDTDVNVVCDDVSITLKTDVITGGALQPSLASTGEKPWRKPSLVNGYRKPVIHYIDRHRYRLPHEKNVTVGILSWTAKFDDIMEWFSVEQARACHVADDATCEYTSDHTLYNYSDAVLIRQTLIPEYNIPKYR